MANKSKSKSKRVRRQQPRRGSAKEVVPYVIRQHYDGFFGTSAVINAGTFSSVKTFGTLQFRLSLITNSTKFTTLYDQYMIEKVQLEFLPLQRDNVIQFIDPANLTESMYTGPAYFHLVPDFDDFTAPTTIDEIISRKNSVTLDLSSPVKYTLTPKSTMKTSDIAANVMTLVPKSSQWIDCNTPNIDHLGLKYCWEIPYSNGSTVNYPFDARLTYVVKYWLKFRFPRL